MSNCRSSRPISERVARKQREQSAGAPHYLSDHPESPTIDGVVEHYENHKMPYRTLRDGDAIVMDGESTHYYTV